MRDNNIVKQESKNKQINQETTTTRTNEPSPPALIDDVVVEKPDHDSGIFKGLGEFSIDDTARMNALDTGLAETPPDSASPPSFSADDALIRQMFDLFEIYPDTAKRLIEQHTAQRCQAVIDYVILKKPKMESPGGWYISELQNNWRGIPDDFGQQSSDNPYKSGKWADIINT